MMGKRGSAISHLASPSLSAECEKNAHVLNGCQMDAS